MWLPTLTEHRQEVVAFVLELDESMGKINSADSELMLYSNSETFLRLDVGFGQSVWRRQG